MSAAPTLVLFPSAFYQQKMSKFSGFDADRGFESL